MWSVTLVIYAYLSGSEQSIFYVACMRLDGVLCVMLHVFVILMQTLHVATAIFYCKSNNNNYKTQPAA